MFSCAPKLAVLPRTLPSSHPPPTLENAKRSPSLTGHGDDSMCALMSQVPLPTPLWWSLPPLFWDISDDDVSQNSAWAGQSLVFDMQYFDQFLWRNSISSHFETNHRKKNGYFFQRNIFPRMGVLALPAPLWWWWAEQCVWCSVYCVAVPCSNNGAYLTQPCFCFKMGRVSPTQGAASLFYIFILKSRGGIHRIIAGNMI